MRVLFCFTVILVLLSSCSKEFVQVFETSTTNTKEANGFWTYESDTIKVTYEFWASKGVMSFSVYNKLDRPIYIDWKNCSFIHNSNKLNYWVDIQESKLISYYGGYFYDGPVVKPGYYLNKAVQVSTSKTVKPERVTFIPPASFYYRSQFYLLPKGYNEMNNLTATKNIIPRSDNPKKMTTVYDETFNYSTTPLKFRNYLAFSFAENSTDFVFIDNEFYLTSVKKMEYKHFLGKPVADKEGYADYTRPSKKNTSFFIKILR